MTTRKVSSETSSEPSSQPYMSAYDKQVEERLQALEERSHTPCESNGDSKKVAVLEARLEALIDSLRRVMPGALPKDF
jgi:hypothetical protein